MAVAMELAWAAGFFDGEGHSHVSYRKNRPDHRPVLNVSASAAQVDRDPLDRLQHVLGGKVHGPYPTKGPNGPASDHYQWRVQGKRNTQRVLNKLLPLLTGAKQEQARRVLIATNVYGPKRHRWNSKVVMPK